MNSLYMAVMCLALGTMQAWGTAQTSASGQLRAKGSTGATSGDVSVAAPQLKAAEPQPSVYELILAAVPEKNVAKLHTAIKGAKMEILPFSPRSIANAFKSKVGRLDARFSEPLQMVFVEEPASVGEMLKVMGNLATISYNEFDTFFGAPEFGLQIYVGSKNAYFAIIRGKATFAGGFVCFPGAIETPD